MDMKLVDLVDLIVFQFGTHARCPRDPSNAVRKWDKKTPYGIHPTWCAMTILTETTLPEKLRTVGAQVLLLHDILEDTTAELPHGLSEEVTALVKEMTFDSFDEEMKLIWERSQITRLLKVYDKTSNLLDGSWLSEEKRRVRRAYLLRLCDNVELFHGRLNITRIARAIAS